MECASMKRILCFIFLSGLVCFSASLELTFNPPEITIGRTKNMTITCDARIQALNLTLVTFLALSKVKDDGSMNMLVELLPGGQRPIYVDSSFATRTQAWGTLDVKQGVYMSVVIADPLTTDAGKYRCSMSYVEALQGVGADSVEASVTVLDLQTLQSELDQLRQDVEAVKAKNCSCGDVGAAKPAFSVRVFSFQDAVDVTKVVPFNSAELDTHGSYNETGFTYTVPINGLYVIGLTLAGASSSTDFQADVTVNHVTKASMLVKPEQTSSLSVNLKLIKGQEVRVEAAAAGAASGGGSTISVRSHRFSSLSGVMLA